MPTAVVKKRIIVRLVAGLFLVALGGVSGYLLTAKHYAGILDSINLTLDTSTPYSLMRPLLLVSVPSTFTQGAFDGLRKEVSTIADSQKPTVMNRYSFYVRDLTDGRWMGINENDHYDPGSLLKVVAAIAAYKQEQNSPGFFSEKFTYTNDLANVNAQFPFAPPVSLNVGQSYNMTTLIKEMLSDSDNAAKDTILSAIDPRVLGSIYTDLSVPKPDDANSAGYTISAYDYSRFFRILYYGTYDIPWTYSNELLQDLSQSTFVDGLVAGVPSGTAVAHKFGEHVEPKTGGTLLVELSDCGIVYHPQHPYFICVMTEGPDESALATVIAQMSKASYRFVDGLPTQ